jgi:dephospho-CoA kinase
MTGPPGAGKNTVANGIAEHTTRLAVIDVDVVRWMIVQPHAAPWDGEEGLRQQKLGVRNTCQLATTFLNEGFDTLILDVLTNATATMYREALSSFILRIVLLIPSLEEVLHRAQFRPARLTLDEIQSSYEGQRELSVFDVKIDNTSISADEVAADLMAFFKSDA